MADFYEDLGYQLPEGIGEVKAESFDYYNHPPGIYHGFIGRLTAKFKDMEGKKCGADVAGAKISHFILTLWITDYLGTAGKPERRPNITVVDDKAIIPSGINQVAELYFGLMISYEAKDQWKVHKQFQEFAIPGHDGLRIIKVDPSKPGTKVTNFQAFPFYYGMPVEFTLDSGKKTGSTYLSEIKLLKSDKLPNAVVAGLEEDFNAILERERAARKQNQDGQVAPPPSVDVGDILGDDMANEYR